MYPGRHFSSHYHVLQHQPVCWWLWKCTGYKPRFAGEGFHVQWHMCLCSSKAHLTRGWSGLPLWMTAPGNILGFDLWGLVTQQHNKYVSTSHCKWAFKNCSIIFLCNDMFRIKHQNSIFYNYIGLWSCHHHVKTAKKLDFGFCFLKKSLLRRTLTFKYLKRNRTWPG